VTATSGTSQFANVTINGQLDMDAGSSATIINLPNPTNPGDAANKAYVDAQDALRLSLTGGTLTGALAMSNQKITGVGTPTADGDAATKSYVDNVAQGLDAKASCRAATTGNITLSGTQTIDGISTIAGDRVLVKDQSTASQNGIYVVAAGSWTRSTDADTWNELIAAFTFIEQGTANGNNGYICTVSAGGTLGVTAVTWAQFSGAGQITAGTGMSKTGNTLNVNTASSARIVVGADEIDLATTGVTASTYKSVTVDQWGRVTAGTNPTTLSGFGITDAYTTTQSDTLLAGKLSLTGGTMSGQINMGAQRIVSLADPVNPQDGSTKAYTDSILGSATSAAASAAAAAVSETNAANSAAAASSSATNAANSASSAATSATNAANSFDSFDDRYLGSKTSDPSVDNDGAPLLTGALYWNSVGNVMKVYTGTAWITFNSVNNPVDQSDIGTAPNEIPLNQYLGSAAYVDIDYFVTPTATQTLTNKTVTNIVFDGSMTEEVFTLGTSGSLALNPANGTVQTCAASATVTFTDSLSAGQSIVLRLTNGASYTINWPTTNWVTSAGNTAPTLTANDTLVFWKISTTLYGAYVGSGA